MNCGKCYSGCVLNADLQNVISFFGDCKPPQQDCRIPSLQIHAFINEALKFLDSELHPRQREWMVITVLRSLTV